MYTASEDCEFGALKWERIRDQFIAGLRDERLAEKLEHLYMSNSGDFTLDRVIEYTRTYCNIQEKEQESYECVDVISQNKTMRAKTERSCGYCGMTHSRGSCPAYGKRYNKCGKMNHFSIVCIISGETMRPKREVNVIGTQESFGRGGEEDENEEDAPFFLGKNIHSNFSKDIWNVDISRPICNNGFKFNVDTGADVNILNYESYFKISYAKA